MMGESIQTTLLISGSPRQVGPTLLRTLAAAADRIIAVDHGADLARAAGLRPDVLLGDFDSVRPDTLAYYAQQGARQISFERDKDATDLELAIGEAQAGGCTRLVVTNALGGRIDHELAAIGSLVACAERGFAVSIVENDETVHILSALSSRFRLTLRDGEVTIGATVSLIPWGGAVSVSACGFVWPLDHATLEIGASRGVSNRVHAAEPLIEVHEGNLLIVIQKGRDDARPSHSRLLCGGGGGVLRAFDLPGFQAFGADIGSLHMATAVNRHLLDVGSVHAIGDAMRVADVAPRHRVLATD
jgi:thiamine pyrophosphokinase